MGKFKVFESRDSKQMFLQNLKKHKKCLKKVGKYIDNAEPAFHFSPKRRPASPRVKQDHLDTIAHNNLKLANKIFDIMEGPGLISDILKQSEAESVMHPGTLNFNKRVKEATRIRNQNISMAMRLDNVKPYYANLFNCSDHNRTRARTAGRSPAKSRGGTTHNAHGVPGLSLPHNINGNAEDGAPDTTRSDMHMAKKKLNLNLTGLRKVKQTSLSARGASSGAGQQGARGNKKNSLPADGSSGSRKSNVLLEHSKIQDGRELEIAVIKEPFQDRYAVLGVDVKNQQKYEVRLTSDDVSSILDGDILVTSLDNVDVWLALLNKVSLRPVEMFSKLSAPGTATAAPQQQQPQLPHQQVSQAAPQPIQATITSSSPFPVDDEVIENLPIDELRINDDNGNGPAGSAGNSAQLEPEAPSIARPTTRPGGRGSRSQARQQGGQAVEGRETSADIYEPEERLTPLEGSASPVPDEVIDEVASPGDAPVEAVEEDEVAAASKIQSLYRGNKARASIRQETVGAANSDRSNSETLQATAAETSTKHVSIEPSVLATPTPPKDPKSKIAMRRPTGPAKNSTNNSAAATGGKKVVGR